MFILLMKVKYRVSEVCKLSETEDGVFSLSCFILTSFVTGEGRSRKITLSISF